MPDAIKTMLAKDVINAKLATAYITVNGKRYLLFQAKKLEATIEKEKKEVSILGRVQKGNKAYSAKGSGTLEIYKNTNLFDEMIQNFVDNGVDTYFDMQVINEDPTSDAGRRSIVLQNCNIDSGTIANFDVDGDWLSDSIKFTFEGFRIAQKFKELDGMNA
ncbi:phage tail tube protein [Acidaminococcus intestini]|nr:MAG TPA: tail tube protein [Caudoviricetes sp.]